MSPYSPLPSLASRGISRPAAPQRVLARSEMGLDSVLALGVNPVGLTADRGQKGAPLADEQVLAQLRRTALDAEGACLTDQLASKPAYRQLDAVREEHATVIDRSKCGAQAAVSVLDGIRKAMVK
ncbi:hypothetical protein AB0D35_25405 [Streptomyces sp. NPDC048301]|uniref:hypothetical protein n=1 Tax=Streptomyces sp. NPDC048301 TaxID=3155631 RepID=UPI00341D9121